MRLLLLLLFVAEEVADGDDDDDGADRYCSALWLVAVSALKATLVLTSQSVGDRYCIADRLTQSGRRAQPQQQQQQRSVAHGSRAVRRRSHRQAGRQAAEQSSCCKILVNQSEPIGRSPRLSLCVCVCVRA